MWVETVLFFFIDIVAICAHFVFLLCLYGGIEGKKKEATFVILNLHLFFTILSTADAFLD